MFLRKFSEPGVYRVYIGLIDGLWGLYRVYIGLIGFIWFSAQEFKRPSVF